MTLLNTAMSRELDNIARFFRVAADYADDIGFDNQLLIKPKSKEPTKHQYDFDVAAVLAFLWKYGLENRFTFNLERNHAALAGHTFQYEIRYTRINDAPGERRRQPGRQVPRLGHRPVPDRRLHHDARDVRDLGKRRLGAGRAQPPREGPPGSLRTGRPVPRPRRRGGHLRQGLEVAHEFRSAGDLAEFREPRYESNDAGVGEDITEVSITFEFLRKYTLDNDNIELQSGEQERLKNLLN